jgi:hypothetical protein
VTRPLTGCQIIAADLRFAKLSMAVGKCRLWLGARSRGGGKRKGGGPYGSFNPGAGLQTVRAHVWAAWRAGKIKELRVPAGMHLDHECNQSLCVEGVCIVLKPKAVNLELRWTRRRNGGSE